MKDSNLTAVFIKKKLPELDSLDEEPELESLDEEEYEDEESEKMNRI